MTRNLLCLFSIAIAAVTFHAVAQERFGDTVQVTIVEVPVTVADRSGNAIRGLSKDDFELLDDGKRVPIEYFEVIDLAAPPPSGKPLPAAAYRNFLLLFDQAHSSPGTISRAKAAATSFVGNQLADRDLVGVATYDRVNALRLVTNFTRDRALVTRAIESIGTTSSFKVADPLLIAMTGAESGNMQPEGPKEGLREQLRENREDWNRVITKRHESQLRGELREQFGNFGELARALDTLRGQKQIILLSEGFDPSLVTGRQELGFQATQRENDAVASGEIWKVDSEQRFGSASAPNEINQMAELFRRSDVRLHAIDIKGIRTDVDAQAGYQKNSNEGLFLMTRPTGGTVIEHSNDLSASFGNLLRQQEVVYILGFKSRGESPGKFHNLKVRTNVRGAQVTSRSGYYEARPGLTPLERTLSLAEMIVKDVTVTDVPLSVLATAAPGPDGFARVPVVVEISGPELVSGHGGNITADLLVYAFDENQQARDFLQQRLTLDVAKSGAPLRDHGIRYIGSFRLPPGDYSIKALVRVEESERIGLVRSSLRVPQYADEPVYAVTAMGDPTEWVTIVSPTRGADAAAALAIGEQPFIPEARPQVTAGSNQRIALWLYGTPVEDLRVGSTITSANGAKSDANMKLVGRTSRDEQGMVKLVFDFKPEGLAAGEHQLLLTIAPKDGAPAVASLPFVVR